MVLTLIACLALSGPAQASTSRQALFNAMGRIDSRLDKTIAKSKAGKRLDNYLKRRIADDFKLTDKFMSGPLYGPKASDWFRQLACVDVALTKATLRDQGRLKRGNSIAFLAGGANCARALQAGVSDDAPRTALNDLGTALTSAGQADAANRVAAIPTLRQQLASLAGVYMGRPIYGVSANEWFRQLGCVNVQLVQATLRELRVLKRGNTRSMLKIAKRCAQSLAAKLKSGDAVNNPASAIHFGSNNLNRTPERITGYFNEDAEYWPTALGPQPSAPNYVASTTVPADGVITEIKLRGYAVRGPYPQIPISSLPIRFSVARPQADGSLIVVTTTDPPFTVTTSDQLWKFSMSDVRFQCCRVQKGDVISFDARNGEFAVAATVRGSVTDTFTTIPDELTMNPGYRWTGTPHKDVELLMQVTEQPDG